MADQRNDPGSSLVVLDAPSNLGLRMPGPGVVPGCYKLAGALRDRGLVGRLGAVDAGHLVAPRYDVSGWQPGDGVFNAAGLAAYTRALADRVGAHVDAGEFPVVLGGDCSILLGPALALRRRGSYGIAYLDGHADFRHAGNSAHVGAAAGEGVAQLTGRGQADVVDLDGLAPYVREADLAVLGVRADDSYLAEVEGLGIPVRTAPSIVAAGPGEVGTSTARRLSALDGYWVHLDVDILDPSVMPAVDSPDPGGLAYADLVGLLRPLLADPGCVGLDVAIFDPDLDPDGRLAAELADHLVAGFADRLRTAGA